MIIQNKLSEYYWHATGGTILNLSLRIVMKVPLCVRQRQWHTVLLPYISHVYDAISCPGVLYVDKV